MRSVVNPRHATDRQVDLTAHVQINDAVCQYNYGCVLVEKNRFDTTPYKIQRYTIYWVIFFIKVFLFKIDSRGTGLCASSL
jgi:hypothetical protein